MQELKQTTCNLYEMDIDFSVERKRRSIDFSMQSEHYHRNYELFYLVSGKCRMFLDHTLYDVEPGTMILIPPFAIHRSIYGFMQESERVAISFHKRYLERLLTFCGENTAAELFATAKIEIEPGRKAYVEQLIQKMMVEQETTDAYSELMKENYLLELAAFLGRCSKQTLKHQLPDETEAAVQQAAEYIFHHYSEPLTLPQMAKKVHMSTTYFSKRFKQVTGFGYKEYLSFVRLREATRLLLETNDSITEIAMKCGFSDANYFGDLFKKEKGISPRTYRKNPQIL